MNQASPVEFGKAIADATRQKIMRACCCNWLSVSELVDQIGVKQPTISHHLAILRSAGLVRARHEGKQTFYTLNQNQVVNCCGQIMAVFAPEEKATAAVNQSLD
jgi:DNA-binding transcriptional ArsR family regulator